MLLANVPYGRVTQYIPKFSYNEVKSKYNEKRWICIYADHFFKFSKTKQIHKT